MNRRFFCEQKTKNINFYYKYSIIIGNIVLYCGIFKYPIYKKMEDNIYRNCNDNNDPSVVSNIFYSSQCH